jgi:hypothetical protein
MSSNSIRISINKVEQAGLTVSAKMMFISPELKDEYYRIKALHKFSVPIEDTAFIADVTIRIKSGNLQEVLTLCDQYANPKSDKAHPELKQYSHLFSIASEGHDRLCFGFALPRFTLGNLLEDNQSTIDKVQEELKVDQNIELILRLAASP